MTPEYLILFDIDGTLLWPDGAGRAALRAALEEVYGTSGALDSYPLAGRTDRQVVHDLMLEAGLTPDGIEAGFARLAAALASELEARLARGEHRVRACPGALDLVAEVGRRKDLLPGLLTGNTRLSAEIKLRAAGFRPEEFVVGSYGDEAIRRDDLLPLAVERAQQQTGISFRGRQVIVIGDTPADVACGRSGDAQTIAVLTGHHTRTELEAAGADLVLADLRDVDAVLAAIVAL